MKIVLRALLLAMPVFSGLIFVGLCALHQAGVDDAAAYADSRLVPAEIVMAVLTLMLTIAQPIPVLFLGVKKDPVWLGWAILCACGGLALVTWGFAIDATALIPSDESLLPGATTSPG